MYNLHGIKDHVTLSHSPDDIQVYVAQHHCNRFGSSSQIGHFLLVTCVILVNETLQKFKEEIAI